MPRVDDAPASLSTAGVSEHDPSPHAQFPHDAPPASLPTHNLLQSLRAELQRHHETITSLRSERDALGKELDRRKDVEISGFTFCYLLVIRITNCFTELELRDVQEKLQRESTNGASQVHQLESKLRSATSRAEELEGSLAGSRSEREKLLASLRDAETGMSLGLTLGDASLGLPRG